MVSEKFKQFVTSKLCNQ